MANRNLLHKNKLGLFKEWLAAQEISTLPVKGNFEVLRFNASGVMPIIFSGKSPDHYSCNEAATPYVRKFIRQSKKQKLENNND